MPYYIIKDADNNEINRIKADLSFVQANYTNYEEYTVLKSAPLTAQEIAEKDARQWRDSELDRTDKFMSVSDYPHTTAMQAYRQALRDWTDSETFPDTKPVFEVTSDE